jgi:hypothetical protein
MDESAWLEAVEPYAMLQLISAQATDRKLRLFACVCFRRMIGHDDIIVTAEAFADGAIPYRQLSFEADFSPFGDRLAVRDIRECITQLCYGLANDQLALVQEAEAARTEALWEQAVLLRDLFSPFRPASPLSPSVLVWREGVVSRLAQAAYQERERDGQLSPKRLAVLADALEEAGYNDVQLLEHLRSPGPHYRGCWAVDALLGRG